MRSAVVFTCLAFAACAPVHPQENKADDKAEKEKGQKKVQETEAWKPTPKGTLKVKYQGKAADAWYELLLDADSEVSMAGAQALQEIGEEAVPYLEDAAVNAVVPVARRTAIQHLPERLKDKYRKQWAGLFRVALKDKSPYVRTAAAVRVADFGFTECRTDLETALKAETDKAAAFTMRATLKRLKKD